MSHQTAERPPEGWRNPAKWGWGSVVGGCIKKRCAQCWAYALDTVTEARARSASALHEL